MKSDLVIPSINQYISAESETDYKILEFDFATISDSDLLYNTDNRTANYNGLGFGTIFISNLIIAYYQNNNNDSDIIDGARL